jgi:hypothetical protein
MPRLNISVAVFCRSGNRGSKRYTRMFVSTSAATVIEILSTPPTILRWRRVRALVPLPLSGCRQVEATEALGGAHCLDLPSGWNDANRVPGDEPLNLVAWANATAIRYCFRNRNLKLRRDLSHIARTSSLSKCGESRELPGRRRCLVETKSPSRHHELPFM